VLQLKNHLPEPPWARRRPAPGACLLSRHSLFAGAADPVAINLIRPFAVRANGSILIKTL